MAINLKEILISESDNIKLDKVNYNFDQLVANGGGPQGFQGVAGDIGYQGVTGYQGYQGIKGDVGVTGPQGSNGQEIWKINPGNPTLSQADTILPIHDELVQQYPPSVIIGYKSDDPEYDSTYIESESQVVINRHSNFNNNLELKTVGSNTSFVFKLDTDQSGNSMMDMSFIGDTGSINQFADIFTWSDSFAVTPGNLITLTPNILNVKVDTIFDKNVTINGDLRVLSGNPLTNHIAVAEDSNGRIVFKEISEIGGTVPIGTIISMLPAYFQDNNKFVNTHTAISPPTAPIDVYVGRGVGEYAGWYICNGKTWSNGANTFITPDLNSFSYNIANDPNIEDPDSQGEAILTNDEVPIIGGSDASLTATYNNGTQLFDVTGTIESTDTLFQSDAGTSGTTYTIKKLPQIIYLGFDDLTWSDNGTGAGIVPPTYTFANWTGNGGGIASIEQTGTINISLGNNSSAYYVPLTSVSIVPTSFTANDTTSAITQSVDFTIVVPAGFSNTGGTVIGTLTASQPTSYNPGPFTTTLNITPSSTSTIDFSPTVLNSYSPSITGNIGYSVNNIPVDLTVSGNYYRTGSTSAGITWQSVTGVGATQPVYSATLINDTTGYLSVPIGERWLTSLTVQDGDSTPSTIYTLPTSQFLNRDELFFNSTANSTSGDWEIEFLTNPNPGGLGYDYVLTNNNHRFEVTGLPYREIEVSVKLTWTGFDTPPATDPSFVLQKNTGLNIGASIHSIGTKSTDINGNITIPLTLRTGIGSGESTFLITSYLNEEEEAFTCQSYKVYPHLTGSDTTIQFKMCGGNTTTITVPEEYTTYICATVGAMAGGADYIIVSGNSNSVTVDNTQQCIGITP